MNPERFKAIASVMIAIVTVLGAGVACRASIVGNSAGNADFAGLVAAIKAEEATLTDYVTVYQHYHAYTDYHRYNELGKIMGNDPQASTLGAAQREAWGIAQGLQFDFFPSRYLKPDGTYDTQRELDETYADKAQQQDLYPTSHFEEADAARLKASLFSAVLIVASIAFWFFTLAQAISNRLKYLFIFGGFSATAAAILFYLIVEFAF
jgi:hypothetical protein